MARTPEKEQSYLVQQKDEGTYVTDENSGARYFQTQAGQWFLLTGAGSPFDEDAVVDGTAAEFLSSLVQTVQDSQKP